MTIFQDAVITFPEIVLFSGIYIQTVYNCKYTWSILCKKDKKHQLEL